VEDHPLAYADFSGEIPEGQYGAGLVRLWDRGTYENLLASKAQPQTIAEGIEAGHLEVRLHGRRLKGSFALIRMRRPGPREYWLLVKMKDEAARSPEASPSATPLRRHAVVFTHTDKVIFPEAAITKGEVLRFYERISERLLPHLCDRPVTLERFPRCGGHNGAALLAKAHPILLPSMDSARGTPQPAWPPVRYVLVNDLDTLYI
jgi:hypothetical protein